MSKQEIYLQIVRSQHEENYRRGRGFDARAATVLGLAATLAGIAAIVLKDFSGPRPLSPETIAILAAFALAAGAAMRCSLRALSPRGWLGIDFKGLSERLQEIDPARGAEWVGDQFRETVEYNEAVLTAKGRSVIRACRWLFGAALLVVALAVTVNL